MYKSVHVIVNTPDGEIDYPEVIRGSLDNVFHDLRKEHPDMTSMVWTITGARNMSVESRIKMEALHLARQGVKARIRAQGKKVNNYSSKEIGERARQMVESDTYWTELAKDTLGRINDFIEERTSEPITKS